MVDRIWDVGIVGGGLGGLAAAALLAGRGLDVIVLERASAPGGRASTHTRNAFFFNQGAHALYRGGAAARVFGRLGVAWHGRRPAAAGLAVEGGRIHKLPTTAGALLTTTVVGFSGKVQGARVMARLEAFDARALDDVPLCEWAQKEIPDDGMRSALEAFVRVSTYAHAPARLSAGAALDQLRLAQGPGVDYVDEGWGSLVSAVARIAEARGATIEPGARVACASARASCSPPVPRRRDRLWGPRRSLRGLPRRRPFARSASTWRCLASPARARSSRSAWMRRSTSRFTLRPRMSLRRVARSSPR